MEIIKIHKDQIANKGSSVTGKAIIDFMIENFLPEVKLTVFIQENPSSARVPAQLNSYLGHKLIGTFDMESKLFEVFSMEEEGISEMLTHKIDVQWKNPV